MAKLTRSQFEEIRNAPVSGPESYAKIAGQYGIAPRYVQRIISRKPSTARLTHQQEAIRKLDAINRADLPDLSSTFRQPLFELTGSASHRTT